jgi:hypothetical protein
MGSTAAPVAPPAAGTINAAQFCGSQCKNSAFLAFLQQAISSRYLPANPIVGGAGSGSKGCPTTSPGPSGAVQATKVGAAAAGAVVGATQGLVTSGLVAASSLTTAIPIVGAILGPVLAILGTVFQHHAAAEAAQTNVLCTNVPEANAALQAVDSALASGGATPSQAATTLQSLLSNFTAAMKSDPSYKTGDAMWGYVQALAAVVAQRLADMKAGVLTGGAPIPSGASLPSLGSSSLLPWLLGGAVLFYLMEG